MQGYNHALSGATVWLGLTSTSQLAFTALLSDANTAPFLDYSPAISLAGAILCAGAALLPDIDHPNATIAYSLPGVTKVIAEGVHGVSGGHRHGTHSWIGIGTFALLTYLLGFGTLTTHGRTIALGSGVLAVFLVAFAVKALGLTRGWGGGRGFAGLLKALLRSWLGPWLISVGTAGAATWYLNYRWDWLPLAVLVGVFLHNTGDSLTEERVPWLWPWNPRRPATLRNTPLLDSISGFFWSDNGYFGIPVLGETNSTREMLFGAAMGLYVAYLALYEVTVLYGDTPLLY